MVALNLKYDAVQTTVQHNIHAVVIDALKSPVHPVLLTLRFFIKAANFPASGVRGTHGRACLLRHSKENESEAKCAREQLMNRKLRVNEHCEQPLFSH
jgi:hypothetical protein